MRSPSAITPAASPENANPPAARSGSVSFWTTIVPRFVFVNVQVTVSPGARSTFETGLPSSHAAPVRSQPAGTDSATL